MVPHPATPVEITGRVQLVRQTIERVAREAGRDPSSVALMAVTKGVSQDAILAAYAAGVRIFGENKVQEAAEKIPSLRPVCPDACWAMIGHLQSNKVNKTVQIFDEIHSVDSVDLAKRLNSSAEKLEKNLTVLIEVNSSGEPQKFGVSSEEALLLVKSVNTLSKLKLHGLMTMGPGTDNGADTRRAFASAKTVFDRFPSENRLTLSMGMSGDYPLAIAQGATMVRIGTALFGERN